MQGYGKKCKFFFLDQIQGLTENKKAIPEEWL